MRKHTPFLIAASILSLAAADALAQDGLTRERFEAVHQLIKPGAGEARWAQVPWMPSTDIWAARKKAAAEGKPLFIWYMAGEPLGTC